MRSKIGLMLMMTLLLGGATAPAQPVLQVHGELRLRLEARDNADFNSERLDGTAFVLSRTRVSLERRFEQAIKVVVQFQDSRLWGEEGSTLATLNHVDLHQAYLDIERVAGLPLQLRFGRQELAFGSERLVGRFDWHNQGRAFDAVTAIAGESGPKLSLWFAQVRDFNAPEVRRNQSLAGVYFQSKVRRATTVDLYALLFSDRRRFGDFAPHDHGTRIAKQSADSNSPHLTRWTAGLRLQSALFSPIQVELETTLQLGNRGPQDIRAYGLALDFRYRTGGRSAPVLFGGYSYGSGDTDPADDRLETFSPLFPDTHRHLGAIDYVGWSNTRAFRLGAAITPKPELTFEVWSHFFGRASTGDHFYRAEGYLVGHPLEIYRRAVAGAGAEIGREVDLFVRWRVRNHIQVLAGVSRFFTGDFLEDTGGLRADNSIFGFLSLEMKF